jgi:hypothetical protein
MSSVEKRGSLSYAVNQYYKPISVNAYSHLRGGELA